VDPLSPRRLPRPISRFIGRRTELARLERLLTTQRLVTLTGCGGCGKTRLAIEVADQLGGDFPGGISFADLTGIRSGDLVLASVAAGLAVTVTTTSELTALVGERRVLMVIDNAEHVIESVARLVQELLVGCPNLTVLVTSRERLDVSGETTWRVPSLSLPPDPAASSLDPDRLRRFDAVTLFVARLADAQPGFQLDRENAALVMAICRRLDGLPLALELAAARAGTLGLRELAARLDSSALTMGSRAAVPRHRTLQAAIAWSHELLAAPEQRLLAQVSCFVGTFDLAAVEAVAVAPPADLASAMGGLVDRCLVEPAIDPAGGLRYRVLEVVRQFGAGQLAADDLAELLRAHAAHYAALVARLHEDERSFRARAAQLDVDGDNVRAALDWATEHDPDLEVRMVEQLSWYWLLRGSVLEARQRTLSALDRGTGSAAERAALCVLAAGWLRRSGDVAGARRYANDAMLLLPRLSDPLLASRVMRVRSVVAAMERDLAGSVADLTEAIAWLDGQPASDDLAAAINDLAWTRLEQGRPADALREIERALAVAAELVRPTRPDLMPVLLQTLGTVLLDLDRVEEAGRQFLDGLRLAVTDENRHISADLIESLACVAARTGRPQVCLELVAAAGRWRRQAGTATDPWLAPLLADAEAASRAALSRRTADQAWEQGLALDLDTVLARIAAHEQVDAATSLPRRKLEIVRLVAAGLSNKEIASRLAISERTVEAHLEHLRARLGMPNRTAIAAWAISRGIATALP